MDLAWDRATRAVREVKSAEEWFALAGWLLWGLLSVAMILGSFLAPLLLAMTVLEYLFAACCIG